MRVDIYRRPEPEHKLSYLVVPEGRVIPEEATNVDWVSEQRGVDFDESESAWEELGIDDPQRQISEKGYAITGVLHQLPE
ncbi:DUF6139 family protein [Caenimonas terrae]|uniref:DUF6139 family protein n=1 Tax=Caenimonas terrae TaxID=696074 RepID=A0ABW0NBV4_9BURK